MFRWPEPHGGDLVDRFVTEEEALPLRVRAERLPRIALDRRELADLELVATGAASPLTGFLGLRDYQSVLRRLRLADGTPWPVPVTLAVALDRIADLLRAGAAALHDGRGRLRGVLTIQDVFVRSAREEALAMYGTDDPAHPGVRYLLSRPPGVAGGSVRVLPVPEGEARAALPREVRGLALRRRWSGIAGLAAAEGVGCIEGTPERGGAGALLGTQPVALRDAPGRDALLQAIVLKNYGAREVLLECERSDWLDVAARLEGEDLGVTSLPVGVRGARPHGPFIAAAQGVPGAQGGPA
jgi:ATP sulfurylase